MFRPFQNAVPHRSECASWSRVKSFGGRSPWIIAVTKLITPPCSHEQYWIWSPRPRLWRYWHTTPCGQREDPVVTERLVCRLVEPHQFETRCRTTAEGNWQNEDNSTIVRNLEHRLLIWINKEWYFSIDIDFDRFCWYKIWKIRIWRNDWFQGMCFLLIFWLLVWIWPCVWARNSSYRVELSCQQSPCEKGSKACVKRAIGMNSGKRRC